MLTKPIFYSLLISIILLISCFTDDVIINGEVKNQQGIVIEKEELWKKDLSKNKILIANFNGVPVFENIVVASATEAATEDWYLVGLNVETGEEAWRWNDSFGLDIWFNESKLKGSILFHNEPDDKGKTGSLFQTLDISNGQTIWSEARGRSISSSISMLNESYYFYLFDEINSEYQNIPVIYKGELHSNSYDSVTIPSIDSTRLDFNNTYGLISGLTSFRGKDGDDYFLFPFNEYQEEEGSSNLWTAGNLYLGLYNITDRKYIYDKKLISEKVKYLPGSRLAEIHNNEIAFINANWSIIGLDIYSGEIIWQNDYDQGVFNYLLVDSVLVIAQRLGADTYTYGLDPQSGNQLWRIPSGGGASELKELNGVVYWKDRGDAKLYAVDAQTGEIYWKLDDPDPESNSWWKSDGVGVLAGKNGEKGKIFATTHLRMYCYEAVR